MIDIEQIYVYENWRNDLPTKMGTLYVDGGKMAETIDCARLLVRRSQTKSVRTRA